MKTNELKLTPEMALWKKNNVSYCEMEFSCGGDSMNDYEFHFYNDKTKEIKNNDIDELKSFFEDEAFKRVEFYVNSDGHYIGESGKVIITLTYDVEEPDFEYDKQAQSEWSETYTEKVNVDLTKDEIKVIQEKIGSFNGGEGENGNVNYNVDCIISDEEEIIIGNIINKLSTIAEQHEFNCEDEASEWYSWTTNVDDGDKMMINKKGITIQVNRSFTEYRPSEN